MPPIVVEGALLECDMGVAPAILSPIPNGVTAGGLPAATVMDHEPLINIPTFGMCSSLANPEVDAATTAALGVLTPMPCVPMTQTPWEPGAVTTKIGVFPALTNDSTCICMWGGEIMVTDPGQVVAEAI
jgi:Domain of unknown function (DUF4280)